METILLQKKTYLGNNDKRYDFKFIMTKNYAFFLIKTGWNKEQLKELLRFRERKTSYFIFLTLIHIFLKKDKFIDLG